VNAYFSSYNKAPWALLWWHRWFGTATAIWAVICACASFSAEGEKPAASRGRLRIALLLGAALVGLSGFLGSALIYGLDHYAWR
jgi:4-hydroxybenzoate polyprenyltransferase